MYSNVQDNGPKLPAELVSVYEHNVRGTSGFGPPMLPEACVVVVAVGLWFSLVSLAAKVQHLLVYCRADSSVCCLCGEMAREMT